MSANHVPLFVLFDIHLFFKVDGCACCATTHVAAFLSTPGIGRSYQSDVHGQNAGLVCDFFQILCNTLTLKIARSLFRSFVDKLLVVRLSSSIYEVSPNSRMEGMIGC